MNIQSLSKTLTLFFLLTMFSTAIAQEIKLPCDIVEDKALEQTPENIVKLISAFKPATAINKASPRYPKAASRAGAEGWVQMSYVIDVNGNVQDPIIEDFGGHRAFKQSALSAIKNWKFDPAMKDGNATEQCHQSVQFDFTLGDNNGATRRFISQYKEADALIKAEEYSAADTIIKKLHDKKSLNRYENAWLWGIDATLADKQGKPYREMKSINRTLASLQSHSAETRTFDDEYTSFLHKRLFILQVQSNRLGAAFQTVEKIKALPTATDDIESIQSTIASVTEFLKSDDHLFVKVELEDSGEYFHKLARNKFAFVNIQGQVNTVEVRCETRREKFTVAEDFVWSIPDIWGECQVMVKGDTETTFDLVEVGAI